MNGDELGQLREYLDDRFGNIDERFTALDKRITVNAEERLAEVTSIRDQLDRHMKRNHGAGNAQTLKKGGIGAILASAAYAIFEMIKRMS